MGRYSNHSLSPDCVLTASNLTCSPYGEVVFGRLDSQPVVMTDMQLGQELAVSYGNIREHRKFD